MPQPPFIAKSPEELLKLSDIGSMSGLDFMTRILDGRLPGPPIADTMGFALSAVERGKTSFTGTPKFPVTNPMGTVHGGWYGTILDSAMACAVMTCLPVGSVYTTLEYKINIIRSIPLGMKVNCTGEVDHTGRSTGIAHGELRGVENGKLYATGSTTCIIMPLNPPS